MIKIKQLWFCFRFDTKLSQLLAFAGTFRKHPILPVYGREPQGRVSMSLSDDKLLSVRNQVYIEDSSSGCSCGLNKVRLIVIYTYTIVDVELEGCLHLHSDRSGLATDLLATDVPATFSNKLELE